MSQADYFLKVDGAPGESQDSKHSSEIEVLSFTFGASQVGSASYGKGLGAGKVSMQDFSFLMKANKAGPKLFLACAQGTHIKTAVLTCRKAGKDQQDYLKVTFTDLLVSSFNEAGSGGSDPIPMQSISLNFSKIEYEYKEQNADGSLGGVTKAHFDLKTNKGG
jgi:type VI secretion system secreted protein Hcp